jgi:hypothetical protein
MSNTLTQEQIEGNKLIAEFMEKRYFAGERLLKYHSSWDWLMSACYKWDNLTDAEIKEGTFYEYERLCDLLDAKVTLYEIFPVWEQLVENIKWYNANKLNQP